VQVLDVCQNCSSGKEKVRETKRQRYQLQLTMQHDYEIFSWTAKLPATKTGYHKTAYSRDGAGSSIHA